MNKTTNKKNGPMPASGPEPGDGQHISAIFSSLGAHNEEGIIGLELSPNGDLAPPHSTKLKVGDDLNRQIRNQVSEPFSGYVFSKAQFLLEQSQGVLPRIKPENTDKMGKNRVPFVSVVKNLLCPGTCPVLVWHASPLRFI